MHARPSVGASVRVGPALERHPRPNLQLQGIRNPVTHPPCCSCGSAHALSSRVEPRAASFAVTRHSCSAALVSWYRVSLCVRSSDRGESRSAERRARMVVVCLGPFPIPRIAVWQLGVSTSVLLYCYYCYRCLHSYWQLLLEGPHSQNSLCFEPQLDSQLARLLLDLPEII